MIILRERKGFITTKTMGRVSEVLAIFYLLLGMGKSYIGDSSFCKTVLGFIYFSYVWQKNFEVFSLMIEFYENDFPKFTNSILML